MKILVLFTLLLPSLLFADKIIIGGFSKHFNSPVPLNETHIGIGIEHKGYELAVYNNSIERTSIVIAKIDRPIKLKSGFSAGYRLGLASGYNSDSRKGYDGRMYSLENTYDGFQPQIQAIFSYEGKHITTDLGLSLVSSLTFKLEV